MYLRYSTKVKVGMAIFVAVICAAILLIFTIGMSFDTKNIDYKIVFKDESVSGLTEGTFVKLLGVEVGKVTKISFAKDEINSIEVLVSINKEIKIKRDMMATMGSSGLTGLKFIEITGGTKEAGNIEAGGLITSKKSPLAGIMDKADVMVEKINTLLTNLSEMTGEKNKESISGILSNLDKLTEETSEITPKIEQSIARLNEALASADMLLKDLNPIVNDVQKVTSTLTTEENLGNVNNMVEKTSQAVEELKTFAKNMNVVLQDKNTSTEDLIKSVETITINLEQFTEKINRDPSIIIKGGSDENIGR